ncbi:MAG: hypothetical protein JSR76_04885 [Verrucomicrobia bacterium]|nr:hypothetical protein [Verrucomicrobiota bacterium]
MVIPILRNNRPLPPTSDSLPHNETTHPPTLIAATEASTALTTRVSLPPPFIATAISTRMRASLPFMVPTTVTRGVPRAPSSYAALPEGLRSSFMALGGREEAETLLRTIERGEAATVLRTLEARGRVLPTPLAGLAGNPLGLLAANPLAAAAAGGLAFQLVQGVSAGNIGELITGPLQALLTGAIPITAMATPAVAIIGGVGAFAFISVKLSRAIHVYKITSTALQSEDSPAILKTLQGLQASITVTPEEATTIAPERLAKIVRKKEKRFQNATNPRTLLLLKESLTQPTITDSQAREILLTISEASYKRSVVLVIHMGAVVVGVVTAAATAAPTQGVGPLVIGGLGVAWYFLVRRLNLLDTVADAAWNRFGKRGVLPRGIPTASLAVTSRSKRPAILPPTPAAKLQPPPKPQASSRKTMSRPPEERRSFFASLSLRTAGILSPGRDSRRLPPPETYGQRAQVTSERLSGLLFDDTTSRRINRARAMLEEASSPSAKAASLLTRPLPPAHILGDALGTSSLRAGEIFSTSRVRASLSPTATAADFLFPSSLRPPKDRPPTPRPPLAPTAFSRVSEVPPPSPSAKISSAMFSSRVVGRPLPPGRVLVERPTTLSHPSDEPAPSSRPTPSGASAATPSRVVRFASLVGTPRGDVPPTPSGKATSAPSTPKAPTPKRNS